MDCGMLVTEMPCGNCNSGRMQKLPAGAYYDLQDIQRIREVVRINVDDDELKEEVEVKLDSLRETIEEFYEIN